MKGAGRRRGTFVLRGNGGLALGVEGGGEDRFNRTVALGGARWRIRRREEGETEEGDDRCLEIRATDCFVER